MEHVPSLAPCFCSTVPHRKRDLAPIYGVALTLAPMILALVAAAVLG